MIMGNIPALRPGRHMTPLKIDNSKHMKFILTLILITVQEYFSEILEKSKK